MYSKSWCLVVLNGPSGDLVPDLEVETFGCNGNFLRRRIDQVVALDLPRVQLAHRYGRKIWTRPRFCKAGDRAVPDVNQVYNDAGNAAIWAAHLDYNDIVIVGADAWMGGETQTVCSTLYSVNPKKGKLPGIWRRRFLEWSGQTQNRYTFVWQEPQKDLETITLAQFVAKYSL